MILDPINSITSIAFYKKVARQPLWRTILYIPYLALMMSVAGTFAVRSRVMPVVSETIDWLEKNLPAITFADGKISTPAPGPYVVRHPSAPDLGIVIDATRTDPVTPALMEQNKAMVYLSNTSLFILREPGRFEVYDLSKTPSPKPIAIDSKFYQALRESAGTILYPASFVTLFMIFVFWKCASGFFYALLALVLNAIAEGGLDFPPLFNIAVYAQTMAAALQAMHFFVWPLGVGVFRAVVLGTTGVYLWLAIQANKPAAAPAQ